MKAKPKKAREAAALRRAAKQSSPGPDKQETEPEVPIQSPRKTVKGNDVSHWRRLRKFCSNPRIFFFSIPLLFLLTIAVLPEWPFNPLGDADSWGYFGVLFYPVHYRDCFPANPVCSLLPLIWPSALFYKLFDPITANYLIRFITFCLLAAAFFSLVKSTLGQRSAIFGTLAMVTFNQVLGTIGTDYSAGRTMLYFTLALWAGIVSVKSDRRKSRTYALLCGVFISLMVSTNFLSIIYTPLLGLIYFMACIIERKRYFISASLLGASGFALGISAMCLFYFCYTGSFWYLASVFAKVTHVMGMNRVHNRTFLYGNPFNMLSFVLGAATIIEVIRLVVAVTFTNKSRRFDYGLALQLPNLVAIFMMWDLEIGWEQETMSNAGYYCHLAPLWFLALAGLFRKKLDSLSVRTFAVVTALLGVSAFTILYCKHAYNLFYPFILFSNGQTAFLGTIAYSLLIWSVIILAGFSFLYTSDPVLSSFGPVIALIFCDFISMPNAFAAPVVPTTAHFDAASFPSGDSLNATVEWLRLADDIDHDRKALLWYNRYGDAYGAVFRQFSSASHFWQDRLVNESFPSLDDPVYDADARPPTVPVQGEIVIVSSEANVLAKARRAFEGKGRELSAVSVRPFSYKAIKFTVYLCEVSEMNPAAGTGHSK